MRDTFVRTLLEIAKKDKNVYIITGDLGFGVLKPFWTELPDQIINAGIAEQNMTSIAAGLAMQGKTVYTYSMAISRRFVVSNKLEMTVRTIMPTLRWFV